MAELDRRYEQTVGRADVGAIDEGLRSYMLRVYNYMASGVAITGVVAYVIYAMSVVTGADGAITGLTSFGNLHVCQRLQVDRDLRPTGDGVLLVVQAFRA